MARHKRERYSIRRINNNLIDDNLLLTTSSTTYSGKINIIESNKKEKIQTKTKNDLKHNEHISDINNNTIDDNSKNIDSNNSIPYSKSDQVKKN